MNMSNELDMSMIEDIIIPDVEENTTTDPVEAPETLIEDTVETPEETAEEKIDTSLKDVEADPIDADTEVKDVNPEVYSTLVEVLKEEGFFSEDINGEDITDPQKLSEAFREEIKRNEFADLTESQRRVLEGFRNGIPEAEVIEHEQTMMQYSQITDEVLEQSVELQKALFVNDLLSKGVSESKAEKLFEIALDDGSVIDEAKASLQAMKAQEESNYQKKIEEQRLAQEEAIRKAKEQEKALKESIFAVDKFMGDIAISQNLKEKVYKNINTIVGYAEDGTPLNAVMKAKYENPLEFDTKLNYLFELTDGFKNLKKFTKRADSKAAKKLESIISNNTFVKSSNTPNTVDPNSFDPGSIVDLI